jgi:hypothetical protein
MADKKKAVFTGYILATGAVVVVIVLYFNLGPFSSDGSGWTIMPGGLRTEWLLSILLIPGVNFGVGLAIIILGTAMFVAITFKVPIKNRAASLVAIEELGARSLSRQIFNRAVVLGLFAFNLAYTAASQDFIVGFWRSVRPISYNLPDPEVMLQLVWLTLIPSLAIIIPIWCIGDAGVIVKNKQEGIAVPVVELACTGLYRFVKGYIGISFLFNLIFLIGSWVWPSILSGSGVMLLLAIIQMASPLLIIFLLFPVPVVIAVLRPKIKAWVLHVATKASSEPVLPNSLS